MKFTIHARAQGGEERTFGYDNMTSHITDSAGQKITVRPATRRSVAIGRVAAVVGPAQPGRKRDIRTLKIQLGLSCNYACEYCSQRFVPHAAETNKDDVEPFLAGLAGWIKVPPERIEFWGGEPFVYWKTLKPLAEALRKRFPSASFGIVTNGSLLDAEKNAWLDALGFGVGISHDGPGQSVRGPDPLDDPEKWAAILDLYARLRPKGRISFNAMLHRTNTDRHAIQRFFVELTDDPSVPIGEGSFIDPYDDGGMGTSLQSDDDHLALRQKTLEQIRGYAAMNFELVRTRMAEWIDSFANGREAAGLGQKCGMDREDAIAVDLRGNVLTCQNVSAVSTSPAGTSHRIGHVADLEAVRLNTSMHWSLREECPKCPVLQGCKGACMFLSGPLWQAACDNAYSDHIAFFVAAFEAATGFAPYRIDGEGLPEARRSPFQKPPTTSGRRPINIPVKVVHA